MNKNILSECMKREQKEMIKENQRIDKMECPKCNKTLKKHITQGTTDYKCKTCGYGVLMF